MIHYIEGHMEDYILTSTYYHIHPNKQLYTKEPKKKKKLQEVFLAFFKKNELIHPKVDCISIDPRIDCYQELHKYDESLLPI